MYTMLVFGILIGIAATLLVQEVNAAANRYKDRKQLEFETAVREETNRRALASGRYDSWGTTDPKKEREWNNIRVALPDDPFADV
jgi:hypothetical protein